MQENERLCENPLHEGKTVTKNCITRFIKTKVRCKKNSIFKYAYIMLIIVGYTSMSYHTYVRNFDWKNEASIYEAGYREEPDSVKVLNNFQVQVQYI